MLGRSIIVALMLFCMTACNMQKQMYGIILNDSQSLLYSEYSKNCNCYILYIQDTGKHELVVKQLKR